jgi:dTDP-4-dehydrorhamnose 3,5-epimerase
MKLTPLGIEGAWIAESTLWNDDRGFLREWFKTEEVYAATGINFSIQQANISQNQSGVIRGIHYSLVPEGQAKWVTCVAGSLIDVVVDIRPNSPTFKKIEYIQLTPENGVSVLVGAGLGHGFESLEDKTSISYLLSSKYSADLEFGIHPFDTDLAINWRVNTDEPIVSSKDLGSRSLQEALNERMLPTLGDTTQGRKSV